jgi:DNA replication and repair protein RecF
MILSELTLRQFRSYPKVSFRFSPGITLISGVNTAGKTNILEAIFTLATGKSFRADTDREMIRWGEELSAISAQLSDGNEKTKLDLMITTGSVAGKHAPLKKYLVNGIPRRMIDFVGNIRAVLFWPEHLELVTDSPSLRRRYLDSVLVQTDREYRRNLVSYERGLRQRNKLLDFINEGTASRHQLVFWNQLLIKAGSYITDKRGEYINFVNSYQLSAVSYQLEYDKSVISEARLEQYKDEEIAAKATLVGPHRDDFLFEKYQVSGIKYQEKKIMTHDTLTHDTAMSDLSKYGSRGEQRLAILWLKLAEVSYIEKAVGERPILLLDDIFSELDEEHRDLVLDLMKKQQTIVTTAEKDVATLLKKKNPDITVMQLPAR